MNKAFERWVHQRYGNRYDRREMLTASTVVKL